ncbi:MAG: alpha-1,2-fucosyltransferase [Candidatus Falkowbacteria bacterium]
MIIVKILGGLGNQLFQYAAGRRLAQIRNTKLLLDISAYETYKLHNYSLHYFNIKEAIATERDLGLFIKNNTYQSIMRRLNRFIPSKYKRFVFEKPHSRFIPDVLALGNKAYLDGYWQNENYFKDIRDILLWEFTLKEPLGPDDARIEKEIAEHNSVSLHIRRGDYVQNQKTNQKYGTCSLDYYHQAINHITKIIHNPRFFIFSDDIQWVKDNLKVKNCEYIDHDASKNYVDLILMSRCKHNIIANSSFSWWGAWLNSNPQKIIIAPKKWFAIGQYNNTELVLDNWVKL